MVRLPFYFNQTFYIEGEGQDQGAPTFFLKVSLEGRCVMAQELPEEMGAPWWFYGVNPGGVAGSGETEQEARLDFFDRVHSVLVDLAQDAQSLEEYTSRVRGFVGQTSYPDLQEWTTARQEVRAGRAGADGYRRITTEKEPSASVEFFVNPAKVPAATVENARYEPVGTSAANGGEGLATAA